MGETLSAQQVTEALTGLTDWSGDPAGIARTAQLPTFPAAINVVDRVAVVAEDMDHHPDMDIRWRKVTFTCSTHSDGGVTSKDIDLARRIDEIIEAAR